ncbi:peptidase inhibitor family I36 protein [Spirillospora sp. NPDC052269]
MTYVRRTLAIAGAALSMTAPFVATASHASAAGRDGVCDSGEFCYYYNGDLSGSVSDFTGSVADLGTTQPSCYTFIGPGNGQGLCVGDNAGSVWNRSGHTVRVYFNRNYGGAYQDFPPSTSGNLNTTLKNNNAGHQFISAASGS